MPSCHRSRAAILVALFVCLSCGGRRDARETAAERALAEFAGSYPAEVAPTGVIRSYDVVAAPAELPLVDGKTLKVWAYNGQVPGPTLRVRLGETLRVRFTNHLPDETTIHWHGVRLPNAMDGVPGVTQPAVAPGATFIYEFTPKDAGTFWFHPHVRASEQVERGLYGVLIVDDAEPPPYTSETIWVLDDWRLDATGQIDPNFNTRHDLAMDGRWGGAVTVNGRTDTTLHVRPGERVRVRMLDSANGRVFAPDFGGLHADVIAVDGLYLRAPVPAVGFQLAPGNRLDVDLVFDQSPAGPVEVWDRYIPQRPNRLVTIVVDGDLVETPGFASPAHGHVPRWRDALDAPIAHTFRLNASSGGPFHRKYESFEASSKLSSGSGSGVRLFSIKNRNCGDVRTTCRASFTPFWKGAPPFRAFSNTAKNAASSRAVIGRRKARVANARIALRALAGVCSSSAKMARCVAGGQVSWSGPSNSTERISNRGMSRPSVYSLRTPISRTPAR